MCAVCVCVRVRVSARVLRTKRGGARTRTSAEMQNQKEMITATAQKETVEDRKTKKMRRNQEFARDA